MLIPLFAMASAGRKQKPWQSRGEDFELDLFEMASWGVGGLYTEVQDAIPKYCQPLKIRRGVVEDPPRFDTREKTIKYYQNVRDLVRVHAVCQLNVLWQLTQ